MPLSSHPLKATRIIAPYLVAVLFNIGLILAYVRAQFPPSATRTIMVLNAWCPEDSTLRRPAPNGWEDDWKHIGKPATREVILELRQKGFTWVHLQVCGGCTSAKSL